MKKILSNYMDNIETFYYDKTIAMLNKVKDNLLGSEKNLRIANDKLQDVTIKKLTKNSPSVREIFEKAKDE